ncbi:hypothetical protein ACFWZ4_05505 [Frateuria sp. GZRe12]|uniref:hypothetical protein n=1 Tax=Frateuria sp. GZRe12 TaxID=3351533 RepID=UPI003EDBDF27
MQYTNDYDLYVAVQDLTPDLMDRYPVVAATTGVRSYVALRSFDKRPGGVYQRDVRADLTRALPTLWITVTDYEQDTITRLLALVEESNRRRRDRDAWARPARRPAWRSQMWFKRASWFSRASTAMRATVSSSPASRTTPMDASVASWIRSWKRPFECAPGSSQTSFGTNSHTG